MNDTREFYLYNSRLSIFIGTARSQKLYWWDDFVNREISINRSTFSFIQYSKYYKKIFRLLRINCPATVLRNSFSEKFNACWNNRKKSQQ